VAHGLALFARTCLLPPWEGHGAIAPRGQGSSELLQSWLMPGDTPSELAVRAMASGMLAPGSGTAQVLVPASAISHPDITPVSTGITYKISWEKWTKFSVEDSMQQEQYSIKHPWVGDIVLHQGNLDVYACSSTFNGYRIHGKVVVL
jgi:hypothetical protein